MDGTIQGLDALQRSKPGRPVGMHVLGWVGGIRDPVKGPLQVISGGTWSATPIGKRLSLDIAFGGTRYVTSVSFEPAATAAQPVAVSIFARAKDSRGWRFVRRCSLQSAATRCALMPFQTDALRLEFDPGTPAREEISVGPVSVEMKRIQ